VYTRSGFYLQIKFDISENLLGLLQLFGPDAVVFT